MERLQEKGIDVRGLVARANSPIRFIPPHGGNPADGYEATILPDICAVLIEAQQKGKRDARLIRLAGSVRPPCNMDSPLSASSRWLMRPLDIKTSALAMRWRGFWKILLPRNCGHGLRLSRLSITRKYIDLMDGTMPSQVADQVSSGIGPTILSTSGWRPASGMSSTASRHAMTMGRLKHKLFQRLTEDIGHPKLREHLMAAVVMLMKYSQDWKIFMGRLDDEYPQWGQSLLLPFPDDYAPPKNLAAPTEISPPSSQSLNAE